MAKLFFLVLVLSALIGCTADSLNPLFTDKDIVFDQALLGTWGSKDGSAKDGYFLFEKAGDSAYRITMVDEDGSRLEFEGHLGYVRGRRFLDLVPVGSGSQWRALAGSELTLADQGTRTPVPNPGLVKLEDGTYLEFAKANSDDNKTHFKLNVRTAHWFCKVATEGAVLRLDCLDDEWLKSHRDDVNTHLAYASAGPGPNDWVVTASTSELQKFVIEQADNKEVFSSHMAATR